MAGLFLMKATNFPSSEKGPLDMLIIAGDPNNATGRGCRHGKSDSQADYSRIQTIHDQDLLRRKPLHKQRPGGSKNHCKANTETSRQCIKYGPYHRLSEGQ